MSLYQQLVFICGNLLAAIVGFIGGHVIGEKNAIWRYLDQQRKKKVEEKNQEILK